LEVGRTAAWAIEQCCKAPGKLGTSSGTIATAARHDESGFPLLFREACGRRFTLLEPLSTFETRAVAQK